MKYFVATVLVVSSFVTGAVPCGAAGSTSPGKSAVYVAVDNVPISGSPVITGQILKAKRNTVLEVDATVRTMNGGSDNLIYTIVSVNGFGDFVQPGNGLPHVGQCTNNDPCTTHALFWVDIDAAEAAHAGSYVGQPLNINVIAGSFLGTPTGDVSLRATVHKK